MKNKILILTLRPLHNGPRIIREINALKGYYNIAVVGLTNPEIESARFYNITKARYSVIDRSIRKIYRAIFRGRPPSFQLPVIRGYVRRLIKSERPELVIVHEPEFLSCVSELQKKYKFKIIFNAHEFYPLQYQGRKGWMETFGRYYHDLYSKYLPRVDLMINVCETISERCFSDYNKKSIIIPNAARYHSALKAIECKQRPYRIVHHGVAIRTRGIETMIEAVSDLEGIAELDLMLVGNQQDYLSEIKQLAQATTNVRIIPPVSFDEIVPFINNYDIGLYVLKPNSFNQQAALPNKLFEFIQARLCIIIGPSSEMAKVVKKHQLGVVSTDFSAESVRTIIRDISMQDIMNYKANSHIAAKALCAENYDKILLEAVLTLNK